MGFELLRPADIDELFYQLTSQSTPDWIPWNETIHSVTCAITLTTLKRRVQAISRPPWKIGLLVWIIYRVCGQDLGQVLFLRVYGPSSRRSRPNKLGREWIYYMAFAEIFLAGHGGKSRAGKIAPSCLLGWAITTQDLIHLARSRS